MKPKVLVTRMIPRAGIELLETCCEVEINNEDRSLSRSEILKRVTDKAGVLGLMADRIDGEFFDAAPHLRGYANYAVGYDNIDVSEATKRHIPISNTPRVLTDATAELAWSLLMSFWSVLIMSACMLPSRPDPGTCSTRTP